MPASTIYSCACCTCWAAEALSAAWGTEGEGRFIMGWDRQLDFLRSQSDTRPWGERQDAVVWRGRHAPFGRDALRYAASP